MLVHLDVTAVPPFCQVALGMLDGFMCCSCKPGAQPVLAVTLRIQVQGVLGFAGVLVLRVITM
jgi:hypothetical protein